MPPKRTTSKPSSTSARPQSHSSGYPSSEAAQGRYRASGSRREDLPVMTVEPAPDISADGSVGASLPRFTGVTGDEHRRTESTTAVEEASARKSLENFHAHLNRLQRKTDTMLRLRNHCLEEIQAWETSHEHLESSTKALVTAVQHGIQQLHGSLNASTTLSAFPTPASRSGGASSDRAHGANIAESSNLIEACHREYTTDLKALRDRGATLKESMNELSNFEFRLQSLYHKIAEFLNSPGLDNRIRPEVLAGNVTIPELSSRPKSTTVPPPDLVSKYFDQEGDVKVFRERLRELEAHYYEGQDLREVVKDRGDSLEVSEEQFERTHRTRREKMEKDLDTALQAADELARKCKEDGYDLSYYRFRKPQGLPSSPRTSSQSEEDVDTPAPAQTSQISAPTVMQTEPSRIVSWRDDVATSSPPDSTRRS